MTASRADVVLRHIRELTESESANHLPDLQLLERFAARHDEAAFAALVRRHGPLVLGVCRRVLGHDHDAEDAFQATFLVLARKAASVGRRGSLATWLYRVAYHIALRARKQSVNRRERERLSSPRLPVDGLATVTGRELLSILDEELHQLPERLRAPLVLCYLEGKTRDEAARELGWSLGTLKRRLEQGRASLYGRVTRRGLTPGALPVVGWVAVSSTLAASTTGAALLVATGQESAVSATIAGLMRESLRATTTGRRKAVGALVILAATLIGTSAALLGQREPAAAGADPPPAATEAPKRESQERPAGDTEMTVTGRILDRNGKPVPEAEVTIVARGGNFAVKEYQVLKKGRADKDGSFRLMVPRFSTGEVLLLAGNPGHALSQQLLNPAAGKQEMTLTLGAEQPLRGRLLDLQGQPVAGVKVSVMRIGTRDDVSLFGPPEGVPSWPRPAVSDADGRFAIAGLPRDQEVMLSVQDDHFASQHLTLSNNGDKERSWTLSPARLLQGKIVYADSGKPAANARLSLAPAGISNRTDAEGRFKISLPDVRPSSLPPLLIYPAEGESYLPVRQEITWPRGAVKHEVEVKVPRGVLVRGKVTEAGSDTPIAGAGVQFVPREADNPNLLPHVLMRWENVAASRADGSFQIVVLPGPGRLLVSGPGLDYIHEEMGSNALYADKPGGFRVYPDGHIKLNLAPKAEPKEVSITLRRGVTVEGRILDPDGKPVARAQMVCRLLHTAQPSSTNVEIRDGVFALHSCDPEKDYPILFLDAEHNWGATMTLLGKQAGRERVTVRLSPCGRAAMRFVDGDGKPLKDRPLRDVMLHVVVTPGPTYDEALRKGTLAADEAFAENLISRKERVAAKGRKSNGEGRFTYTGLIPGATYRLSVLGEQGVVLKREFRVEAGKIRDLGDIVVKPRG